MAKEPRGLSGEARMEILSELRWFALLVLSPFILYVISTIVGSGFTRGALKELNKKEKPCLKAEDPCSRKD